MTRSNRYWVIETIINNKLCYWAGTGISLKKWTIDINNAIKYNDKASAIYDNEKFKLSGLIMRHTR